ncbi:hypothetical protein HQ545_06220 [Candidatus Woesearchaeota archaeon]|nr:hypothetical protein [Candidatus Woesearchaeota archaeon]
MEQKGSSLTENSKQNNSETALYCPIDNKPLDRCSGKSDGYRCTECHAEYDLRNKGPKSLLEQASFYVAMRHTEHAQIKKRLGELDKILLNAEHNGIKPAKL